MTGPIPRSLIDGATAARREATERWWSALDDETRRELEGLDDPARDDITKTAAGPGRWAALPLALCGHFVDPEDARDDAMWRQDLIEYLNAHPEIGFSVEHRRFHICRAHAHARRVLETGRIPHDFACPLARSSCPFARALAHQPGRTIVLSVGPRTSALRGW